MKNSVSSNRQISSFIFTTHYNPSLLIDATGAIDYDTHKIIVIIKQSGKINLSALKPSFTIIGSYVKLGGVVQDSGISSADFSESEKKPLEYSVIAEDGTSETYYVYVKFGDTTPHIPGITSLVIQGLPYTGNTLTASYFYYDGNADPQGPSIITWEYENGYKSNNYVLIQNPSVYNENDPNSLKITVPAAASGHRIRLTVQPISDPDNTTRATSGVNKGEENGIIYNAFSKSVSKASVSDCVVINEIKARDENSEDDVFVELYNPTDQDIDLSGYSIEYSSDNTQFSPYVIFSATSPSPRVALYSNPLILTIPKQGYFLTATSDSIPSTKRISDFVVNNDTLVNLTPSVLPAINGIIRLTRNGVTVDSLSYGSAPQTEGPCAAELPSGSSLSRTNGYDTDHNIADFSVKTMATPLPSGLNEIAASAPGIAFGSPAITLADNGINDENGNQTYQVNYTFYDANYDAEGQTIFQWRPFYLADENNPSSAKTYLDGGSPEAAFIGPFNQRYFTIAGSDYDMMPDGKNIHLEVSVTPVSQSGTAGTLLGVKQTYTDTNIYTSATKSAKVLIFQVIPYRNIVELYVTRGGLINNLSVAFSKYTADLTNKFEDVDSNFQVFLCTDSAPTSVSSGKYIAVLTKPTAGLDAYGASWDSRCSIKADKTNTLYKDDADNRDYPYNISILDDGYINTVGGAVSVLEKTGYVQKTDADGNPLYDSQNNPVWSADPVYKTMDMIAFAAGNFPSEKAAAFKRFLIMSNYGSYVANGTESWKLSGAAFPYTEDAVASLTDDTACDTVHAQNDYIKFQMADPQNYLVYRKPMQNSDKPWYIDTDADISDSNSWSRTLSLDYAGETEYVINGIWYTIATERNLFFTYETTGDIIVDGISTGMIYMVGSNTGEILFRKTLDSSSNVVLSKITINSKYTQVSSTNTHELFRINEINTFAMTSATGSKIDKKDLIFLKRRNNGGMITDNNKKDDFSISYNISSANIIISDTGLNN
jgi:hypothetical protein